MPPRTPATAALLDLVIDRAPRLRAAGVTHLQLDGFAVTLAPADAPLSTSAIGIDVQPSRRDDDPADEDTGTRRPGDPLGDPATYAGGRVPGFRRPPKE